MIEVERRVEIPNDMFSSLAARLEDLYGQPETAQFTTLLLRGQNGSGRIRRSSNQPELIVFTTKTNLDNKGTSEESNMVFSTSEYDRLKDLLASYQFNRVVSFPTVRRTFHAGNNLQIELSDHGNFGKFLEVESLLTASGEISNTVNSVEGLMEELNFMPQSNDDYEAHYDRVFENYGVEISAIDNLFKEMISSNFVQ